MRIRKPFAGAFFVLSLGAAYLGLTPISVPYTEYHSDKVLHFLTFFVLTVTFYWIFETSRRRALHLTLIVCTLSLGVGSEIAQGALKNGRDFDLLDVAANLVGSGGALGLCAFYHRRMLERKRAAKGYRSVATDEEDGAGVDLELGEGTGPQESGVTAGIDEELDHWDENADDDQWDEGPAGKATDDAQASKS